MDRKTKYTLTQILHGQKNNTNQHKLGNIQQIIVLLIYIYKLFDGEFLNVHTSPVHTLNLNIYILKIILYYADIAQQINVQNDDPESMQNLL